MVLAPDEGRTRTFFPDALPLTHKERDYLIVPHDLPSTVKLKALGYRVPSPIIYYDWCGGEPFSVQRSTCDMLTTNPRSYVLNAMGTGKTKTVLWAWDYLNKEGACKKLLVVATLSTLHAVWGNECFSTLPHRKVVILHGEKKKRLEALNDPEAEIFVINHDGLRTIQADIEACTGIDCLVLDELAVYRNNSQRSKSMRKFAQRFGYVFGLTGAPMPNAPTDVWAQAKIVTPQTAPKYYKQAEEMLMNRVNKYTLIPKPNATQTAFHMLQPSVRYQLDDVVELPEVSHHTIDIPMTAEQKHAYKAIADAFQAEIKGERITAVNAAVAMGKLLQTSGGYIYAGEKTVSLDNGPRTTALVDLINANERKVLVFAPYLHTIQALAPLLEKAGIETAVVHGGVSGASRSDIFRVFQQTDKFKAIVAHPQCLAHGLTLTAADTIIWFLPTTSLDIYDQANARITRVGQKHKQKVYHLQSTKVERKIYSLLRSKANIQSDLLRLLAEATEEAK